MRHDLNAALLDLLLPSCSHLWLFHAIGLRSIFIYAPELNLELIQPSLEFLNLFLVPIFQHKQLLVGDFFLAWRICLIIRLLGLLASVRNAQ